MNSRNQLINEMVKRLYQHGVTIDSVEDVLREFYKAHSITKYSVLACFRDALIAGILAKATEEFLQRKKQ